MIWTAFVLGFVGSFHCLGMCGPIAMALHGKDASKSKIVAERLLYNLGRALTYTLMGAFAGVLGKGLTWVVGYQVYLTVILGVLLVLIGVFSLNPEKFLLKIPLIGQWFTFVRKQLGQFMREAGWHSFFTIGLMNGFLPCGLVYMALVNAVAIGTVSGGATYMLMFGLGTLPLMLGVAIAGEFVNTNYRSYVKRLYPMVFVLMGGILLWRAYNVGTSSNITDKAVTSSEQEIICH